MFGSYIYKRVSMLSFFEYNNRKKMDPSNGLKPGRENARLEPYQLRFYCLRNLVSK